MKMKMKMKVMLTAVCVYILIGIVYSNNININTDRLLSNEVTDTHYINPLINEILNNNISNYQLNIKEALNEAKQIANLIYQRFEFHNRYYHQFFLGSANLPYITWDIMKYKIAKKAIDSLITGNSSTFLMLFGGSSVTAGHDNYLNQSYPYVFKRRMKKSFQLLGIRLIVRNIAMGANNCRPYNLCYDTMGGSTDSTPADWYGWEQSFNCGKARDIFEMITRIALWNKAIVHFSASGAFTPECKESTDTIPYISEDWSPDKANITSFYPSTFENVTEYRETLNSWFVNGNSVARFTDPLGENYKGAGYHGFSVWGHSNNMCRDENNTVFQCSAYDVRSRCYEDGGLHWMTKEASVYGSDTGKGRSWHPTVGMHLLRGEVLAYNYINILIDAAYMIEQDLQSNKSYSELSNVYYNKLVELQTPNPLDKLFYCSEDDCGNLPQCFTNYNPHYHINYTLDKLLVGNHTGWNYVFKSNNYDPKYGYLDSRPCYEATGPNLEINLLVTISRNNSYMLVCGYSQKESLKHALFYLDANINTTNIENYLFNSSSRYLVTTRRYKGDECTTLMNVPNGTHILTISTDPEHPEHTSSLTHIITFK